MTRECDSHADGHRKGRGRGMAHNRALGRRVCGDRDHRLATKRRPFPRRPGERRLGLFRRRSLGGFTRRAHAGNQIIPPLRPASALYGHPEPNRTGARCSCRQSTPAPRASMNMVHTAIGAPGLRRAGMATSTSPSCARSAARVAPVWRSAAFIFIVGEHSGAVSPHTKPRDGRLGPPPGGPAELRALLRRKMTRRSRARRDRRTQQPRRSTSRSGRDLRQFLGPSPSAAMRTNAIIEPGLETATSSPLYLAFLPSLGMRARPNRHEPC